MCSPRSEKQMKKQDAAASIPSVHVLSSGDLPGNGVVPAVPEGFKIMDGAARQALLKVPAEQRAEVDQAMEQLWNERVSIAKDLGTLAPDADRGKALEERMLAARDANRKAQALAAYTDEQEAMANHAVAGHLNAASRDIEHMAERNPQIAERYRKVLTVVAQRRDAIATGIARAKASKAEAKKA
jgi:hypothetical protein